MSKAQPNKQLLQCGSTERREELRIATQHGADEDTDSRLKDLFLTARAFSQL